MVSVYQGLLELELVELPVGAGVTVSPLVVQQVHVSAVQVQLAVRVQLQADAHEPVD